MRIFSAISVTVGFYTENIYAVDQTNYHVDLNADINAGGSQN